MAIVTLSRELGSKGSEIADSLASRLGFTRLDKDSLEALLQESGMSRAVFEREDEKSPGFWEQLTLEKNRYLDFMKAAMYRFAEQRDCVVIGRGGNVIFRDVPGALKLRVVAPQKVRAQRLRERFTVDEHQAVRMIRQSDHDRAGYHRYFFATSWDAAAEYDLVINTAEITTAQACDLVAALLDSPARQAAAARSHSVIRNLRIGQDVVVAILYRSRVPLLFLDATCADGVVTVSGTARSQSAADQAVQAAACVDGVTKVINGIEVVEFAYYAGF